MFILFVGLFVSARLTRLLRRFWMNVHKIFRRVGLETRNYRLDFGVRCILDPGILLLHDFITYLHSSSSSFLACNSEIA